MDKDICNASVSCPYGFFFPEMFTKQLSYSHKFNKTTNSQWIKVMIVPDSTIINVYLSTFLASIPH